MTSESQSLVQTLKHDGETATDAQFLRQLADWVIDVDGNVNVAVRLKTIAESMMLSEGKREGGLR